MRRMALCDGLVVLVTGASSGIGRAAAEIFAREGAAAVVVADVDAAGGRETVAYVERAGARGCFLEVDVSDERAIEQMVSETVSRFGRLDCAHNNAAICPAATSFHTIETEQWERVIRTNLTSVFWCLKYELIQMLAQPAVEGRRGAIVNTSSGAGIIPAPGQPWYTAAKHGVLGLTKNVASEYKDQGIRCNAICPGITDTQMLRRSLEIAPPAVAQAIRASGGMGRPEDVAAAAVWLCSPAARWVNGQSLVTDGGSLFR
jgi:NAD(P)-dependent dehydrogenase (short-subunit alcohol dehydrogenase family)